MTSYDTPHRPMRSSKTFSWTSCTITRWPVRSTSAGPRACPSSPRRTARSPRRCSGTFSRCRRTSASSRFHSTRRARRAPWRIAPHHSPWHRRQPHRAGRWRRRISRVPGQDGTGQGGAGGDRGRPAHRDATADRRQDARGRRAGVLRRRRSSRSWMPGSNMLANWARTTSSTCCGRRSRWSIRSAGPSRSAWS